MLVCSFEEFFMSNAVLCNYIIACLVSKSNDQYGCPLSQLYLAFVDVFSLHENNE